MEVEANVRSPPPPVAVTVPSMTTAPDESLMRHQDAVPVAAAVTPAGSANVELPPLHVPNDGSTHVTVANSVPVAVSAGAAGREPERISMVPGPVPPSMRSVTALPDAFRAATESPQAITLS